MDLRAGGTAHCRGLDRSAAAGGGFGCGDPDLHSPVPLGNAGRRSGARRRPHSRRRSAVSGRPVLRPQVLADLRPQPAPSRRRDRSRRLVRARRPAITAVVAVTVATAILAGADGKALSLSTLGRASATGLLVGLVVPGMLRLSVAESGTSSPYVVAITVAQLGAIGLATALATARIRDWRLSVRLTRLAVSLQSSPAVGYLAVALGRAAGDPQLHVAYWAPERGYVDAEGTAVADPSPSWQQRVTLVARRGKRLAAFVHSSDVDGAQLDRVLRPALRLSLENQRLRAAALAEL